jgi:outer membrane biosynthesis protein TonB
MQGLSVELILQTIIDFWPFFATVALVFLLIFHLGGVCRRLEKEVGLQRARIKELMLMFQELQKIRTPVRAATIEESPWASPPAPAEEESAAPPQEEPPAEPASPAGEGPSETAEDGYEEEPPAEDEPATEPAPPQGMFQQEIPQEESDTPEPRQAAAHEEEPPQEEPQESAPHSTTERAVIACESCGNKLAYPKTLAGKRARCPACKTIIRLP